MLRWVVVSGRVALAVAWLLGCGETARNGGEASAAGAPATAGSGSGGAGGGTVSGGGKGGTGAAGGGAGTAGAPAPVVPCGGELAGDWVAVDHPVWPAPDVNECWNLQGGFSGGQYSAYSRYPVPDQRRQLLRFTPEGDYSRGESREGSVTVEYSADCLVSDSGVPTCAQLEAALHESGLGEGSYFEHACSDRVEGGCRCVVEVAEVGGESGQWVADAAAGTVELSSPFPQPNSTSVGYCVDAQGLRFDARIDARWRQTAGLLFTRP